MSVRLVRFGSGHWFWSVRRGCFFEKHHTWTLLEAIIELVCTMVESLVVRPAAA